MHSYGPGGDYGFHSRQAADYKAKYSLAASQYSSYMATGGPDLYDALAARNDPAYGGRHQARLIEYEGKLGELESARDSAKEMAGCYGALAERERCCTGCGQKKEALDTLSAGAPGDLP